MQPYAKMNQVDIQVRFTNTLKRKYDENQIQQCFINLFKNGIEAMKENGGTSLYRRFGTKKEYINKN